MPKKTDLNVVTGEPLEDPIEYLTVRTEPTPRPERAVHVAYLERIYARGARVCIGADAVTLGRSHKCTVQLEDPLVSARHALLQITDGGVLVHDLGSRNGTFVDGHHVGVQMRVTATAVLMLGRTAFRILLGDELRADGADGSPKDRLECIAKDRVVYEYQRNGGNLTHAAAVVGVDRRTARDWLRERRVYREPNGSSRTTKPSDSGS